MLEIVAKISKMTNNEAFDALKLDIKEFLTNDRDYPLNGLAIGEMQRTVAVVAEDIFARREKATYHKLCKPINLTPCLTEEEWKRLFHDFIDINGLRGPYHLMISEGKKIGTKPREFFYQWAFNDNDNIFLMGKFENWFKVWQKWGITYVMSSLEKMRRNTP